MRKSKSEGNSERSLTQEPASLSCFWDAAALCITCPGKTFPAMCPGKTPVVSGPKMFSLFSQADALFVLSFKDSCWCGNK